MKDAMNASERFRAVLNFQPVDRLPIVEWASYWTLTRERWESEGMPFGLDSFAMHEYFGMDQIRQFWQVPLGPDAPTPIAHGSGIMSTPDDYHRLKKAGVLYPEINTATRENWRRVRQGHRNGQFILMLTLEGFFWFPRRLFGIEKHLYAFYDYPDLMKEINADLVTYNLRAIEQFCEICHPDFMTIAEDLSYNHGPMLSEPQFDEFMLPFYRQITPRIKELGIKTIIDSDGDITTCAGWFTRAGADGILPLERQAGVDVALLRQGNPRQCYIGGYDKMVMDKGEAAVRAEFERLLPTARQGGFIISCDHQTPPSVSLDQYRQYLRCFREYAVAAG